MTAEGAFGGVSNLLAEHAPSLFVAAETYPVGTRFAPTLSATRLFLGFSPMVKLCCHSPPMKGKPIGH